MKHKSVLLNEVIEYLNLKQGGKYIDATVGYGGHSSHILKEIGKEGVLFAFDQDDEAISYSTKRLSKIGDNFTINVTADAIQTAGLATVEAAFAAFDAE